MGMSSSGASSGGSSVGVSCSHSSSSSHSAAHVHPHVALLFPFVALLLGIAVTHLFSRVPRLQVLPYTVVLLLLGFFLGLLHVESKENLGTLSQSIGMWLQIDPHLLLYAFLPVLLFGDAMGIIWHDFRRVAPQCVILAGPGVLLGTGAMYLFARYAFNWTDYEAAVFGSILAATDPVAVVSLLKEMGASRVLTMQIAGESLLNDGMAIVVWSVFYDFMMGDEKGAGDIIGSFCRLAFGGTAFGLVVGLLTVRWLAKASNKLAHSDFLIQLSLTITMAYLAFFIGENELKVSGVLAAIFAALMLGKYAAPFLVSQEGTGHVWHTLEFFGNTILFVLCGVIQYVSTTNVRREEFGWLLLLYLVANLCRGAMIFICYPFLNLVATSDVGKVTWKECLVMTWGGLRGAVGLALVLVVRNGLYTMGRREVADRMVFHVAGFAGLTLIINATTCGPLLSMLELTKPSNAQMMLVEAMKSVLEGSATDQVVDMLAGDGRFAGVSKSTAMTLLKAHHDGHSNHPAKDQEDAEDTQELETEPSGRTRLKVARLKAKMQAVAALVEKREDYMPERTTTTPLSRVKSLNRNAFSQPDKEQEQKYWWWGFEPPIELDFVQYELAMQSCDSVCSGRSCRGPGSGDFWERAAYRKLFLSMLRAEYQNQLEEGMLPVHVHGAEHLLASVDAADDFSDVKLSDWESLNALMFYDPHCPRSKIRHMMTPYFAHYPIQSTRGYVYDLFTVVVFIDAHHLVCHRMLSDVALASSDAREMIVRESVYEMELAHRLLKDDGVGKQQITAVRTEQLMATMFKMQAKQVQDWQRSGVVSSKEAEELLHWVLHAAEAAEGMKHSRHMVSVVQPTGVAPPAGVTTEPNSNPDASLLGAGDQTIQHLFSAEAKRTMDSE